jgi:DNA (cytosine-5)-methyltransferase 1
VDEYKNKFIQQVWHPENYRDITAVEAGRLQGFPEWFEPHKKESVAHKQFGNAVSVPVAEAVISSVLNRVKIS